MLDNEHQMSPQQAIQRRDRMLQRNFEAEAELVSLDSSSDVMRNAGRQSAALNRPHTHKVKDWATLRKQQSMAARFKASTPPPILRELPLAEPQQDTSVHLSSPESLLAESFNTQSPITHLSALEAPCPQSAIASRPHSALASTRSLSRKNSETPSSHAASPRHKAQVAVEISPRPEPWTQEQANSPMNQRVPKIVGDDASVKSVSGDEEHSDDENLFILVDA